MAESPHRSELERALQDLSGQLDFPPVPELTGAVRRRIQQLPRRAGRTGGWSYFATGWPRLAAALLAVLVLSSSALLALSPGVRTGVADHLGLRGVQIVVVSSPTAVSLAEGPALPTPIPSPNRSPMLLATPGISLDVGQPVTLAESRSRADFHVLVPQAAGLGTPDAVYLDSSLPGGMVSLVWAANSTLPALPNSDVGLLINELRGSIDKNLLGKTADPSHIHVVTVNGSTGYWISGGPHYVAFLDPSGGVQVEQDRLAGNTLLWEQDGITFRLESELSEQAALKIAESLR